MRRSSSARGKGLHTGYFLMFPRARSEEALRAVPRGLESRRLARRAQHRLQHGRVRRRDGPEGARRRAGRRRQRLSRFLFAPPTTRPRSGASSSRPAEYFASAASPVRPRSRSNMLDPEYLLENELILIGSPDTVAGEAAPLGGRGLVQHVLRRVQFRQYGRGRSDALDPSVRERSDPAVARLRAVLTGRQP